MSTETNNTNLPTEELQTEPGVAADAAIAAEVSATNRDADSDSQSSDGIDNPPLTRAQRRAAQFNKGGNNSSGPRAPFAGGKSNAPGATGADRVAPIPTKHAGRGK